MPPIDYTKFDHDNAVSSGGVTGSKQVPMKEGGKYYQLKPSILDNKVLRRLKAKGTDRENYGEVIASKISRSILMPSDFEGAPEVSLVYDKVRKKTPIASKYLEGEEVRTLDKYFIKKGVKIKPKHHVQCINGTEDSEKGQYDISGEKNSLLRKDIAQGIAVSIISGDHDINPGNLIVVTKKGKDRVARIDFGHAFNDLLNAPKRFGGGVRNKDNQVLDFLNRDKVAGFKLNSPFGAPSKLWRDYPGMIPTQEMANALKELSQSQGLEKGAAEARAEFMDLLKEMRSNNDQKGIKHLQKSLEAISTNVGGAKLDPKLSPEQSIEVAFANIEKFAKDNQNQMKDVAKLMQLQVEIDEMLKAKKKGIEPSKEQLDKLSLQYEELKNKKGIEQKNDGIEWIKTDAKTHAYKGNLQSYIDNRAKKFGIDKEKSQEYTASSSIIEDAIKQMKQRGVKFTDKKIAEITKSLAPNIAKLGRDSLGENDRELIVQKIASSLKTEQTYISRIFGNYDISGNGFKKIVDNLSKIQPPQPVVAPVIKDTDRVLSTKSLAKVDEIKDTIKPLISTNPSPARHEVLTKEEQLEGIKERVQDAQSSPRASEAKQKLVDVQPKPEHHR